MENESKTKVITGLVRFSYPNVFHPKAAKSGGKEKYSVSLLIPKKSKKMIANIEAAITAAAQEGKETKFNKKDPKKIKNFWWPLRDGDEEDKGEEYEDMFFLSAKSDYKPTIVDEDRDEILDEEDFYAGCWGRASINFYPYNQEGGIGIACGLNNLQKLKDDERFGGSSSAADDFADDLEEEDDLLG